MMSTRVIFFLLFTVNIAAYAQDKRDYQWMMGNDQEVGSGFRALKFDFNNQPFSPETRDAGLRFDQNNTSLCDKEGRLLLYTNGCAIANRDHTVIPGGDDINEGEFFEDFWFNGNCSLGYPGGQDIMILEDPLLNDGYYIIHKTLERESDGGFGILSLSYTYVDLRLDNGLGAVTESNIDFFTIEKFLWSYLTAIYKSNGRDWWLINPGADSKFYVFSIDEEGIYHSSTQEANHSFNPNNASASGDAKFSPDGTKYAYFNLYDGLLLYDFDRDTGLLSNVKKLEFPIPDQAAFATCEWSPNSEFLYLASADTLWQLEVDHEDLEDGKLFIAEHNGVEDPFSTRFFQSTLGPDCRIYIRPGSSSLSFHVINKPNKKGVACDLVQQGNVLPVFSSTGSFPNFPRFRVDDDDKCDSSISNVFGEDVYWKRDLKVYPNPSNTYANIQIPDNSLGDILIFNAAGQMVLHQSDNCGDIQIDISDFPAGIYSIEYIPGENVDRLVYSEKLVVIP